MEAQQQQQQQGVSAAASAAAAVSSVGSTLQRYSSPEALMAYLQAGSSVVATAAVPSGSNRALSSPHSSAHSHAKNHHQQQQQQQQKHRGVEQRDADLVPLAVTAQRSACPRKRAAAAAALRKSTAARQRLEAAARAAAAHLLVQPATGRVFEYSGPLSGLGLWTSVEICTCILTIAIDVDTVEISSWVPRAKSCRANHPGVGAGHIQGNADSYTQMDGFRRCVNNTLRHLCHSKKIVAMGFLYVATSISKV
jgi:hypothetical protein